MRILYLADVKDVHTYRWVKYFADKGNDIHVISFKQSRDLENLENVHTHLLKRSSILENSVLKNITLSLFQKIHMGATVFNPFFVLKQVKKLIKEIKPDVLHGHSIIHHTIIAALTGFHPFVVSAWGSDVLIYPKESKIVRFAVKFALRKADLVTSDGGNLRKALIELGIEPQKIYRIYWGTDTRKFNPGERSEKIRKELEIFDSPMIISPKNLEPVYDIESLVRSIPLVLKEVPEAKFVIAGKGSQEAELKQLAKSLGVSDSVRFVGWIPSDEFPKYLASADIYVCTSLSDGGLAISTKEAMACELPVVITDLEVNTEWIKDGENGFIVPLKDPKTLAEKIICLLKNEDVRMKFGELGRKLVKEGFEYDKELKKVENIYEELIREHKK